MHNHLHDQWNMSSSWQSKVSQNEVLLVQIKVVIYNDIKFCKVERKYYLNMPITKRF
jgi:hypothetical protein